ncbi:hypothetical protein HN604_00665 [archaeon]|nr:hypothetical protein [archaeon]MBT6182325.1 hypothetical protein [archaeon]MBT6606671.1 hypothetical protein [archaeon]MBT7251914.1 hypothetical protein [archaeon]MBT7660578.1 hypothetical protein [archaeon]
MCSKCGGITGVLFLIFGILYAIQDFSNFQVWITPWSALFLIIGLSMWGKGHCKTCQSGMCEVKPSKKKRR